MTDADRYRKLGELTEIEARLEKGWTACDQAPDPATKDRYERVWLNLLHQYEHLYRELHPGSLGATA